MAIWQFQCNIVYLRSQFTCGSYNHHTNQISRSILVSTVLLNIDAYNNRSIIGRRYAAVLPLPVFAAAQISFPAKAKGIHRDWIGVGVTKPISLTARRRGRDKCNSVKFRAGGSSCFDSLEKNSSLLGIRFSTPSNVAFTLFITSSSATTSSS